MSDLLTRATTFTEKYISLHGSYVAIDGQIKMTQERLERSKLSHQETLAHYELNERGIEVMKKIVETMSIKGIQRLKELLSYGMSVIFEDKNYSIDIEIAERGDVKTAEFYLVRTENEVVYKEKLRDSVGGGIQTVVSLILRIYFSLILKLRRFVALDESLSQLSDVYVDGLFSFLKRIVSDLDYRVLWISHDPRFIPYADKIYKVKDGHYTEEKKC